MYVDFIMMSERVMINKRERKKEKKKTIVAMLQIILYSTCLFVFPGFNCPYLSTANFLSGIIQGV